MRQSGHCLQKCRPSPGAPEGPFQYRIHSAWSRSLSGHSKELPLQSPAPGRHAGIHPHAGPPAYLFRRFRRNEADGSSRSPQDAMLQALLPARCHTGL